MRRKSTLVSSKPPKSAAPIEGTVDSLIQGVSQQPPHLRLVGQAQEQINGWSSPVEGLCKRNPIRFISKILPTPVTDFYMEMMPVISGERYSVMVLPTIGGTGTTMLLTLDGQPASVDVHGTGLSVAAANSVDPLFRLSSPGAVQATTASYLHNDPGTFEKKYVLINNGPLGLLLNREKPVKMSTDLSPTQTPQGMVFVQGVAYEVTYTVKLNGAVVATVTTPKASDSSNKLSTSDVATKIATAINAVAGFTAQAIRHVVWVKRGDNADFTMTVDDDRGNSLARSIKGSVTSPSELPLVGPNGFTILVAGDPGQTADDAYLKFTTTDGAATGDGGWAETVKPGIQYKLDSNTMPLVIYRAARGVLFVGPADGVTRTQVVGGQTYTYTFPQWGARTAGDDKTVPDPAFIGKAIKDHVIFRGRYSLVAGQSVIFSETDDIFNFFQDSSLGLTSADSFSVLATGEISSELNWLLSVDETILAFSQYAQFQVRPADADVLTPETAIILRLSNLEMNPNVRPRLAGPQILFATQEFGYTHFREYSFYETPQRRLGLNLGGSNDICAALPKYIQGLATHWDIGETIDMMVCSTPVDRKTLFVYKYLFSTAQQGIAKQQASWSKFVFSGDVRWMRFLDNELYLVQTYSDGTYATHITSDELEVIGGEQIHLDRLLLYPECNARTSLVTATYDPATRKTTFILPYNAAGLTRGVIRYVNGTREGLMLGAITSGRTLVCEMHGDFTGEQIAFGEDYKMTYEFSTFYVPERDQARSRVVGKLDGRTQLLRLTTHHFNTGAYQVRVKRKNRGLDTVQKFRARFPNVMNNRLGQTDHIETGTLTTPILAENTSCQIFIESNSWLPVTITGATWEGAYNTRSKGVG